MYESGFLSPEIENFRNVIRSKWPDHFSLAEQAARTCHFYKTKLIIHTENPQEVCAAAVFLKLLSDLEASLILLERGMISQCRSLLRVAIETSVTLAKVCLSDQFAKAYGLLGEQVRHRMLKGIRSTDHGVLKTIKAEVTDELMEQLYQELQGEPEKNLSQWAKDVGMKDVYETIYRMFSADIHCSPQSLTQYFLFDGENIKAIEWGPNKDYDCSPPLIEIARLYLDGLARAAELFKVDVDAEMEPLVEEHARLGRQGKA